MTNKDNMEENFLEITIPLIGFKMNNLLSDFLKNPDNIINVSDNTDKNVKTSDNDDKSEKNELSINDKQVIEKIQKAFGRYIKYVSGGEKLEELCNYFFPFQQSNNKNLVDLDNFMENYLGSKGTSNYGNKEEKGGQKINPLYLYPLMNNREQNCTQQEGHNQGRECTEEDKNNQEDKIDNFTLFAAWSNLLFSLGLFSFENSKNLGYISNKINYVYRKKKASDQFIYSAKIKKFEIEDLFYSKIINLNKQKLKLVFIDDSLDFAVSHKLMNAPIKKGHEKEEKLFIDLPNIQEPKVNEKNSISKIQKSAISWIYTGRPYDKEKTEKDIDKIFESNKRNKENNNELVVFIVDFIYKEEYDETGKYYNTIIGDNLIKYIRKKAKEINKNILIFGYTGGSSPFTLESGVKAGADQVIFKQKGKSGETVGHNPISNISGIFDLLWAISWNYSLWSMFQNIKHNVNNKSGFNGKNFELYTNNFSKIFDLIKKYFADFPNLRYESPFWQNYLEKFKRDMLKTEMENIIFKRN